MTLEQTGIIMDILTAAYPRFYAGPDAPDKIRTLELWAEMFRDDDVALVAAAVKALIASDRRGFPPHIGAVKDRLRKVRRALPGSVGGDLTWAVPYVRKLAASVTDGEAEMLHAAGLRTWREAEAAGVSFTDWAREYWGRFPAGSLREEAGTG